MAATRLAAAVSSGGLLLSCSRITPGCDSRFPIGVLFAVSVYGLFADCSRSLCGSSCHGMNLPSKVVRLTPWPYCDRIYGRNGALFSDWYCLCSPLPVLVAPGEVFYLPSVGAVCPSGGFSYAVGVFPSVGVSGGSVADSSSSGSPMDSFTHFMMLSDNNS